VLFAQRMMISVLENLNKTKNCAKCDTTQFTERNSNQITNNRKANVLCCHRVESKFWLVESATAKNGTRLQWITIRLAEIEKILPEETSSLLRVNRRRHTHTYFVQIDILKEKRLLHDAEVQQRQYYINIGRVIKNLLFAFKRRIAQLTLIKDKTIIITDCTI